MGVLTKCSALTVLLIFAAGVAGAGEDGGRPAPKLVCLEPEYAFGALVNTQEVVHEFVIRNEGDGLLEIRQVRLPCGCMLLRLMDDRVEPGGQTVLRARFPLKGLSGAQRKRILLITNDPAQPRATLQLAGEAVAELEARPRQIFWGNLREDAADEKVIEVRFGAGRNFRLLGVSSASARFTAELETADGASTGRIRVRTAPPLPRGAFRDVLTARTDHPRFPTLAIPMSGRVVGDLYTIPDEILLVPTSAPVARAIMVYASRKQKFSVLRVDPPATNIETRIRPSLFSGCRVELKNLVADPALDGRVVRITTDYAPAGVLEVPLRIRPPE